MDSQKLTGSSPLRIEVVDVEETIFAGDQEAQFLLHASQGANVLQTRLGQLNSGEGSVLGQDISHLGRQQQRGHCLGEHASPASSRGGRTVGFLRGGSWRRLPARLIGFGSYFGCKDKGYGLFLEILLCCKYKPTDSLHLHSLHSLGVDLEDVDGFRVGGGAEEVAAGGEDQRGNADAAHSSSELLDPLSIFDAEDPDDSATLGGGGQQSATGRECQCREGRIMSLDRDASAELAGIEDAQLPAGLADGEGQQGVEREGAQALLVGGDVVNGMQDLHVANVVDVYALRQADNQALPVHPNA